MTVPASDASAQAAAAAPTVSIVMAAYNRPEVLTFAIRSVLAQDFTDWELTVIGDHCSEATGAAVAAFDDPRIRYINLPRHYGDQSGPNTIGAGLARGRFIAFLNHDDLWFPDHLSSALALIETTNADVLIGGSAKILPETRPDGGDWSAILENGAPGPYDPARTIGPASCLVLKTEAAKAAGAWRPAGQCYASSSQEWLFRIWYHGFAVRTAERVSLLRLSSGRRPGSYLSPSSDEHGCFERLMTAPDALRSLLVTRSVRPPPRTPFRRAANDILCRLLNLGAKVGLAPTEMHGRFVLRYRRGEYIASLRRIRGLPS